MRRRKNKAAHRPLKTYFSVLHSLARININDTYQIEYKLYKYMSIHLSKAESHYDKKKHTTNQNISTFHA